MRWVARLLIGIYPAGWRARYGDELRGLVDEMGIRPQDLLDLGVAAISERMREARSMNGHPGIWWSRAAGGLGLLAALPSAIFVVLNLLQYQFGVGDTESTRWWIESSSDALALTGYLGGPVLAIVLAILGMGRFGISRGTDGSLAVMARFRPTWLAMVTLGVAGLVLAIVVGYGISENLLELS